MAPILFVLNLVLSVLIIPDSKPTKPTSDLPIVPTVFSPLMVTADGGQNWVDLTKEIKGGMSPISIYILNDEYLIGASNGIFRGTSLPPVIQWAKELSEEKDIIDISPGKSGPYAVSMWNGFFQYNSLIGRWMPADEHLAEKGVFAVTETKNGSILAGTYSGVYRSADHGNSWQKSSVTGIVDKIKYIDGVLFACGEHGLWRSEDEGMNWVKQNFSLSNPFFIEAIGDRLIAIAHGQVLAGIKTPNAMFESRDNGKNWKPVSFELPKQLTDVYEVRQAGEYIFVCGMEGLFQSADQGATWRHVMKFPENKGGFLKLTVSQEKMYAIYREGC
jgi:photosystem II stability/assembly factor-like uncharacterized protein